MATETALPQTDTLVTGEELVAMGDIGPCELVEGRRAAGLQRAGGKPV